MVGRERADDDAGLRRSRIAAARPIAAVESRGSLSSTTLWSASAGSCASTAARCARPVTTMMRCSPEIGRESVPGVAEQRLPGPGEVVQELRGVGAGQRPQPRADAAGGDHAVEPVERCILGQASVPTTTPAPRRRPILPADAGSDRVVSTFERVGRPTSGLPASAVGTCEQVSTGGHARAPAACLLWQDRSSPIQGGVFMSERRRHGPHRRPIRRRSVQRAPCTAAAKACGRGFCTASPEWRSSSSSWCTCSTPRWCG